MAMGKSATDHILKTKPTLIFAQRCDQSSY